MLVLSRAKAMLVHYFILLTVGVVFRDRQGEDRRGAGHPNLVQHPSILLRHPRHDLGMADVVLEEWITFHPLASSVFPFIFRQSL